jgi:5-methylcytosine-specific restriction endonuclease McrA
VAALNQECSALPDVKVTADPVRKVCSTALAHHRARARADHQALDYGLAQLEALARRTQACPYCGAVLSPGAISFDHRTPLARRADYRLANVAVVCPPCQLAKGALSADEYMALLALLRQSHPAVYGDVLGRLRAGGRRYRGQ